MAKSISFSFQMNKFVSTNSAVATELSLSGNGVNVEVVSEQLVVTAATSVPSGTPDEYKVADAQFTAVYNKANDIIGIIGVEDLVNGGKVVGGVYDVSGNKSVNIRFDGTSILVLQS